KSTTRNCEDLVGKGACRKQCMFSEGAPRIVSTVSTLVEYSGHRRCMCNAKTQGASQR
ncbi:hypothetical protein SERLADRAFT_377189, partial [Serpula lacrymans var. lacrymans S7.9]